MLFILLVRKTPENKHFYASSSSMGLSVWLGGNTTVRFSNLDIADAALCMGGLVLGTVSLLTAVEALAGAGIDALRRRTGGLSRASSILLTGVADLDKLRRGNGDEDLEM